MLHEQTAFPEPSASPMRCLVAGSYAPNEGSIKAFLKAGWQEEGRRTNLRYCEWGYVDVVLLGIARGGAYTE